MTVHEYSVSTFRVHDLVIRKYRTSVPYAVHQINSSSLKTVHILYILRRRVENRKLLLSVSLLWFISRCYQFWTTQHRRRMNACKYESLVRYKLNERNRSNLIHTCPGTILSTTNPTWFVTTLAGFKVMCWTTLVSLTHETRPKIPS